MSIEASRQPGRRAPAVVATIGTAATFVLFFFVIEMPLNWASAIGMGAVPVAFGLGVYRPHLLPGHVRSWVLVLVGALVLVPLLGLMVAGAGTGSSGSVGEAAANCRTAALGWSDHGGWTPWPANDPVLWNIRLGDPLGSGEPYEWELNGDAALAGLSGLRVEACVS